MPKARTSSGRRRATTCGSSPGDRPRTVRVREVVEYDGGGTDGAGVLMPLAAAQQLLGKPGLVKAVFVSNAGGVGSTDAVMRVLRPAVAPLGLEADNTKQDALETADEAGSMFMSFFTTFGSFSIAAGILLIFLIFVMLAAERRGELGIARAVGTRRGHLVQMFLYEGITYDLAAALVGALVGIAVAYGMVLALASAFATTRLPDQYAVKPASFVLAYAIGVLLTLVVVAFSAWRVSRMNIVAAIRNLPEDANEKRRRRRWVLGIVGLLVGAALASSGVSSKDAVVLGLGVSIVILSLVPILRVFLPVRAVRTGAGLVLIAWFLLPFDRWILGQPKVNFGIFVLGGLMIVVGASWTLMYNADVLLGALGAATRRMRGLAPVLKMSMAYPLRSLFRTGVTLAMFTLVVFTLVVGATTSGAFGNAFNDNDAFGGGFDVRATGSPAEPDRRHDIGRRPRARTPAGRLPGSREHLDARGQGPPARHDRKGSLVRRPRRRRRLPAEHDLQARRLGARLFVGGSCLERDPDATQPGGRRPVRRAAPRELELRDGARLQAEGLLPRGQDIRPGPRRGSRPADGEAPRPEGRRRPLRQHAGVHERDVDVAAIGRRHVRRPGSADDVSVRAASRLGR